MKSRAPCGRRDAAWARSKPRRGASARCGETSFETKLPMADVIILATSRAYQATLWTQGVDFEGMADVRYVEKH